MKNKKILYIAISISIIVLILILSFFSCNSLSSGIKIESVNNDRVFLSHYSSQNNNIDYLSDLGTIWYRYSIDTNEKTQIYDGEILSPGNINYRENNNNAVVYSDYPNYNVKHHDFSKNKIYDLSEYTKQVIWDNSKEKIYYTYNKIPGPDDENSEYIFNINESNYSGEEWRTIKDLSGTDYVDASLYPSLDETYIYYMPTPIDNDGGTLKRLYINTKQDEIVTQERIVYSDVLFSPDTSKIAFLNNEGKLVIQNIDDKESIEVIYEETINIDQISWTNDNKYIYILKDLNTLVKINTENSKKTEYTLDNENVNNTNTIDENITSLGINSENNILYFTYNNYLYRIPLN